MAGRFAFIRPGSGPLPIPNHIVPALLQERFPQLDMDLIEVRDLLRKRKGVLLINLLFLLKEYGFDLLLGRKDLSVRECFFATSYLFKVIKKMVSRRLAEGDYLFSFQMQSLFDASLDGLPHFLYTDHTVLANLDYPQGEKKLYSRPWIKLERHIYHNTALNFTRSRNISSSIIEQYGCPADRVACVYAGFNTPPPPTGSQARLDKHILFVGFDWERKGGPELASAFPLVLEAKPDAHLTIVGCRPDLKLPNCTLIGKVPVEELGRYYQQASIFCLPTRLEPFGVVFLEAMSYRLPVVATRIGAIPEFVIPDQTGYLVNTGDVQGLAQALIQLVGDPDKCRAFGQEGYRLVEERYNWEKVGDRFRDRILSELDSPL